MLCARKILKTLLLLRTDKLGPLEAVFLAFFNSFHLKRKPFDDGILSRFLIFKASKTYPRTELRGITLFSLNYLRTSDSTWQVWPMALRTGLPDKQSRRTSPCRSGSCTCNIRPPKTSTERRVDSISARANSSSASATADGPTTRRCSWVCCWNRYRPGRGRNTPRERWPDGRSNIHVYTICNTHHAV